MSSILTRLVSSIGFGTFRRVASYDQDWQTPDVLETRGAGERQTPFNASRNDGDMVFAWEDAAPLHHATYVPIREARVDIGSGGCRPSRASRCRGSVRALKGPRHDP